MRLQSNCHLGLQSLQGLANTLSRSFIHLFAGLISSLTVGWRLQFSAMSASLLGRLTQVTWEGTAYKYDHQEVRVIENALGG